MENGERKERGREKKGEGAERRRRSILEEDVKDTFPPM